MNTDLPIIEARAQLTKLPERFEKQDGLQAITVTRRGKPVMAIMPIDKYQALLETVEIIQDDALLDQLRSSINQVKASQLITWQQAKADLQA